MLHLLPAAIMFVFTVAFASVFLIPATSFVPKNAVVGFYWTGMWAFLSAICALAGAEQTLNMVGLPTYGTGEILLQVLLLIFIIFVAGKAAFYGAKRFLKLS